MNKKALKKAVLLFIAEFVVWIIAAIVIGAVAKKDWSALGLFPYAQRACFL